MNKEPQNSVDNSERSAKVAPPLNAEAQFSEETLAALRELGAVLDPMYRRLRERGFVIKDGKLIERPSPTHDDKT